MHSHTPLRHPRKIRRRAITSAHKLPVALTGNIVEPVGHALVGAVGPQPATVALGERDGIAAVVDDDNSVGSDVHRVDPLDGGLGER